MTISISNPQLGQDEIERVTEVIEGGMLADGPEVRAFEDEFASYCGAEYAVATANGTTALHAALEALDVGPGDRVVTTPFTFIATANAITLAGAEPAFVDIDPETYNIDPDRLEERLRDGDRVDAVVAVHLYGLPADVKRLRELANEYDFALVEDAAQAHGATVDGERVGTFGDAACFSFYPTKNMTTGEGGMITTDDPDVAANAAQFVDHGRTEGYEHAEVGHNFRMTSIAAAIGRVQLDRLPTYTERRQSNAETLTEELADTPVRTPTVPDGRTHVFHQYTIRYEDRDGLKSALAERDIDAAVYYPVPIHRQEAYEDATADAPESERAAEEVLSLPVHPGVSSDDARDIAGAVREVVR
ncbi:DegT/DnrJ/EryC1/StrS family aminotransferase [Halopelagius fulvigenes]|uniref:DegT/DnrJ/EryC1/StrS family aminotransferase n=1 Tax=Halopelagius fulvigenes TaxID=1198324 RepID=A0ABD5TX55_9EURY